MLAASVVEIAKCGSCLCLFGHLSSVIFAKTALENMRASVGVAWPLQQRKPNMHFDISVRGPMHLFNIELHLNFCAFYSLLDIRL